MNGERKYDDRHAGGGQLPAIRPEDLVDLGPCPACGAALKVGMIPHPKTQRPSKIVAHPVPFCHYYGATDPEQIVVDVRAAAVTS